MSGMSFIGFKSGDVRKRAYQSVIETSRVVKNVRAAFHRKKTVDFSAHRQKVFGDFSDIGKAFFVKAIKNDVFKHSVVLCNKTQATCRYPEATRDECA